MESSRLWTLSAIVLFACALCITAQVQQQGIEPPPVTDICLGCICEGISGCDRTLKCSGDTCGLFRITWAYWADAGKPTLQGEPVTSETAYPNCVNEPYCAARAVQGYMRKFGQDCNGDGVIDCLDHALIHKLGGYGCRGQLSGEFAVRFQQCLAAVSNNIQQ